MGQLHYDKLLEQQGVLRWIKDASTLRKKPTKAKVLARLRSSPIR